MALCENSSFRAGNLHFAQKRQVSRMDTNAELADMHSAYHHQIVVGQPHRVYYAERYSMRRITSHNFFARLHQKLRQVHFERADKGKKIPAVEQNVLQHVERNPRTSTRIANSVGVSHCSVWRILREQECIRFTCSVPDTATGRFAPRVAFAQWYLGKCYESPFS
ncbi:hypothetical protein TNCV_1214211 [Trichonephila clavipes]|nr:hypothetical protein TNCV_1214211 [Trichonephila clavipes]